MRVMVIVKASTDSETGRMPTAEELGAMGKFNDQLIAAGIMKDGAGLHPTSKAKRVAFDGASRTVRNGPFTPVTEQIAGFWIWEVKDMNEAAEWAKKCPNPMPGPSELEIRPFFEEEDFAYLK